MRLKIASTFSISAEYVTQTGAILAVRGAGKSNTAAVIAEEMFRLKLPFVVVDPVGSWWGLRSSGDGTAAGLALPIFGGEHADVPLERGGGDLIADLVIGKRLSCVLDLSAFDSEGAKKDFLLRFARRLYTKNRDPLHLFLEEADDYIPQKPFKDEAQLLRAWENIVRRGRARGLGMTMITQRSASINKNVLTQVETLFAMRTTSPQDRKAIEEWVKYHGERLDILESLSSLKNGEAWIWSPHFLKIVKRVQVRRRATFDSGATPKNLKASAERPAATMADIDLGEIQKRIAETIERVKQEDPKELRRQIRQLEAKVKELEINGEKFVTEERLAEREEGRQEQRIKMAEVVEQLGSVAALLEDASNRIGAVSGSLTDGEPQPRISRFDRVPGSPSPSSIASIKRGRSSGVGVAIQVRRQPPAKSNGHVNLGKAERVILAALIQYGPARDKKQLAIRAGYSHNSGGFNNSLGKLRSAGYVDGFRATEDGAAALPDVQGLPSGKDLRQDWLSRLGKAERTILEALIGVYPNSLTKEQIGQATGYSATSGGFNNALGKLRSLELAQGYGDIAASEDLF